MANKQEKIDINSADFGEMTLAKIPADGVVFQLDSVEKGNGKFGDFRLMKGSQDGEYFQMKSSSQTVNRMLDEYGDSLKGRVVKIVPNGAGMEKRYRITTVD